MSVYSCELFIGISYSHKLYIGVLIFLSSLILKQSIAVHGLINIKIILSLKNINKRFVMVDSIVLYVIFFKEHLNETFRS